MDPSNLNAGMSTIDYVVIAAYFLIAISAGLIFSKRASKGVDEFFLAGRSLTWWMAGGSMVAAMFASDTPLFHTGNVRDAGLSAGWMFIFPIFGVTLAAAVFAPLMRRTRVVTDNEFIELRYSGGAPAPFRAFLALYGGLFVASLIMGWVTKGAQQTLATVMDLTPAQQGWAVAILLLIVLTYSMAAGLWGVVMADLFQYIIASAGSLFLAYASLKAAGGLDGLRTGLAALGDSYSGSDLHFIPNLNEVAHTTQAIMFTVPLIVGWIFVQGAAQASSTQHQGQRILACKSERDASLTYIFFAFCYYILNGLPWFLIGLCSVVVLGVDNATAGIDASEKVFPKMITTLMPVGLMGLMVASLFAAFMSCVSVLLNWGSSYLINDFYRRFIKPEATDRHYVWAGRFASVLIAVLGGIVCMMNDSLAAMMLSIPTVLMGATLVFLARWLWWRINIWSEISAYIASLCVGLYVEFIMGRAAAEGSVLPWAGIWATEPGHQWETYGQRLMTPVIITFIISVIVTLLTPATNMDKLKDFYARVRPPGPGLWHVRNQFNTPPHDSSTKFQLLVWVTSLAFLLGAIFTAVTWLQGNTMGMIVSGVISVVGLFAMNWSLNQIDHVKAFIEMKDRAEGHRD